MSEYLKQKAIDLEIYTFYTSFPWSPSLWSMTHVNAAHDSKILINPDRVKHSPIPPPPSIMILSN